MRSRFLHAVVALIAIGPLVANAVPLALDLEFEGSVLFEGRNFTLGWAFSVNEALTLDALGTWDQDADGLNVFETVSLWTSAGALLSSVVVDNTATAVAPAFATNTGGQWLLADVADIFLGIGDYVIGANRFGGSADAFQIGATVIATDPRITYLESRFSDATTFGFPSSTTGGTQYFGPTFSIVAPVPEPTTLALFGIGLAGIAWVRRRKLA